MNKRTFPLTIHHSILEWAKKSPNSSAIAAPGRSTLNFHGLWEQVQSNARALQSWGLKRNDRVAIALPQGAEMAVSFLSVSAVATGAPINPLTSESDLEVLLERLKARALIVEAGVDGPIRNVATRFKIPLLELTSILDAPAGVFRLRVDSIRKVENLTFSDPDDIVIVLPTSGTTSQPKLVPLTHRKWCAAADNTRVALGLTQNDRCLNIMPLFHAHGLGVGVLASLMAGAAVMCTPTFDAAKFFRWMEEFRPTWYTGVPTMHQAILSEAPHHKEIIARTPLRFIRSASSLLPLGIMMALEQTFNVLVTQGYGLSEAPQLTNTPLDYTKRKVESLGIPGSSEIAIMDEVGRLLEPNNSGEIVCRGPVVMDGYLDNPTANGQCYTNGWFRTGDLGYLDNDGHLFMTGRLKEIINRGGEKVLPQEVDQVLMAFSPIAQAVTFGVPDPVMGEEIAVAVTLRPGMDVKIEDIRKFAIGRLSEFKVPRRVLILPAIPTGPTGKLVRRDVAERFGLLATATKRTTTETVKPPKYPLEYHLIHLWEELLGFGPLGVKDDFFNHGGDSLLAARMMAEIEKTCRRSLHPSVLFSAPTVEALARLIAEHQDDDPLTRPLIEIQRGGRRQPFVFLNGDYYGGGMYCRKLAHCLDPEQPFYVFSPYDIENGGPPSIIAQAKRYLRSLKSAIPSGPYLLGGYSHAGLIAYEMARLLKFQGDQVAFLMVLDMPAPDPRLRLLHDVIRALWRLCGAGVAEQVEAFLTWRYRVVNLKEMHRFGLGPMITYYVRKIEAKLRLKGKQEPIRDPLGTGTIEDEKLDRIAQAYSRMIEQYFPGRYKGRVTLFSTIEGPAKTTNDKKLGWGKVADDVQVVSLPGNHRTCIMNHVEAVAKRLQNCLDELKV
jgi:acyl-CoA synthetase (AMP-forming)/AMP-acid ligase II/thioesterase domain-containing protein